MVSSMIRRGDVPPVGRGSQFISGTIGAVSECDSQVFLLHQRPDPPPGVADPPHITAEIAAPGALSPHRSLRAEESATAPLLQETRPDHERAALRDGPAGAARRDPVGPVR